MQFNNIKPLFPALHPNNLLQFPVLSQLVEKRASLKSKIINKHIQNSNKSAQFNLLLQSLDRSPTKIIHLSGGQKQYFSPRHKNPPSTQLDIKVENPFSRERRYHIKLRPLKKDQETQSHLQLKCSSLVTRKQKVSRIKYKTETPHLETEESNLIDTPNRDRYTLEAQDNNPEANQRWNRRTGRGWNRGKEKQIQFNLERAKISMAASPLKKSQTDVQKLFGNERAGTNKPLIQYNQEQLRMIKAESYCVIESTGQVVLSCRSSKLVEIASLTKIMTACVVMKICREGGIDPSKETVVVKSYVEESTGTTAELFEGDIYTVEQLLYGLLLPSGNDSALVLADWGGKRILEKRLGEKKERRKNWRNNMNVFIEEMNTYSQALGLVNTTYRNPHGLPNSEAKSTALEQSKLAAYSLQNPLIQTICKTLKYQCQIPTTQGKNRKISWQNTNKLLRREGFIGIKTGITVSAGPCLTTAYRFRDKTYIVTVLRSSKVSRRFKDSRRILHWVLVKLFEGSTCFEETLMLEKLGKNNKYLDSDYSEDEAEFKYEDVGVKERARRRRILINDL